MTSTDLCCRGDAPQLIPQLVIPTCPMQQEHKDMPTNANSSLPAPKSWDELEDICRDSFGQRWLNPNLVRHGRQGQTQHGVDIYGDDDKGTLVGIQCKNTSGLISKSTVDKEVANAEKFSPPIGTLYIATSCDSDSTLQEYVRLLSQSRTSQGKFKVEVVFWPAIVQDLSLDPVLVQKHYPQYYQLRTQTTTPRDRDVKNLTRLLEAIDFDSLIGHLDFGAKYIHFSVEEHLTRVLEILNSPTFSIQDASADQEIHSLVEVWEELRNLMGSAPYDLNVNNVLRFNMPGDAIRTPEELKVYNAIDEHLETLGEKLRAFATFVIKNYGEIDIHATSMEARKHY
ncbi:TPA: hypothetical protein ACKPZV_002262 [Stenotrophomonas maltophilia]